jgi:hypothetical protein
MRISSSKWTRSARRCMSGHQTPVVQWEAVVGWGSPGQGDTNFTWAGRVRGGHHGAHRVLTLPQGQPRCPCHLTGMSWGSGEASRSLGLVSKIFLSY